MDETSPAMVRLSVNINDATARFLEQYTVEHAVSYTEAIRRATGYLQMAEVAQHAGEQIIIRKPDRTEMEIIPIDTLPTEEHR